MFTGLSGGTYIRQIICQASTSHLKGRHVGSYDSQDVLWEGVEEAELLEEGHIDCQSNFLTKALRQLSHNLDLLTSISPIQPVLQQ